MSTSLHRFAKPSNFLRLIDVVLPWASAAAILTLSLGLYLALFASPPDYQQGEMVRIMYVHVPAAWGASMIYGVMALGSAAYLIWRHPVADVVARASAPIGAAYALLTLVTGALWGKPVWGAWWVWDARLTSMLILFFLYVGYIALGQSLPEGERLRKSSAVLALLGFINLPIIKFSVAWNTLHQPASLLRTDGPTIHGSMLTPLLLMIAGFTFFYMAVLFLRAKAMLIERKIRRAQMAFL